MSVLGLSKSQSANLLAIYDLSLDGQRDAQCVREAKSWKDLADALQDLPDQGECCRLYIAGDLASKSRDSFQDHLQKIVPLYGSFSSRGFDSLSTQWAERKPTLRHALTLITMGAGQRRHDLEPIPVTCSIGCYRALDTALVIVIDISDDTGLALNEPGFLNGSNDERSHQEVFGHYKDVFLQEIEEFRRCHHIGHSQEVRVKLYLLQFYRTAMRLYEEFSEVVDYYSKVQTFSYSYSSSQTLTWPKAVADASHYQFYLENATSVSIVARSLVNLVRETCAEQDLTPEIKCLLAEVEALSDVITSPFSMLGNRFVRQMDLMNTSRNIQDSRDSRLLNLLACIFLPASLATSLLSMNTRFHDLGLLLYDFCGVIVLFASILALIFSLLKVYHWTQRKLAARMSDRNPNMLSFVDLSDSIRFSKILFRCFLLVGWSVAVFSFVVGMVKDVSLGLQILGYGTAFVVVYALLSLVLTRNKWMVIFRPREPGLSPAEFPISDLVGNLEEGVKDPAPERA